MLRKWSHSHLLLPSRHLENLIVNLCICVLWAKSNGPVTHVSGVWRLCSCVDPPIATSSLSWYIVSYLPISQPLPSNHYCPSPQWVLNSGWGTLGIGTCSLHPKSWCRAPRTHECLPSPHRHPGARGSTVTLNSQWKLVWQERRETARKGNIFPDIWTWDSIFSLCTMSCKLGSPPWPQPSSRRPVWFNLHSLCRAILDCWYLQATHHSLSFPTSATPQPHLLALSCCSEQIFKNDTTLFKSTSPHQLSLFQPCILIHEEYWGHEHWVIAVTRHFLRVVFLLLYFPFI